MHVDRWLSEPAARLRARCCLGARRRWRRFDLFGRPEQVPCCAGNTFAVQGTTPWRCTLGECAAAMGIDDGHMGYDRLAQSLPPAYIELVFSQMCMRTAHARFGAPVITFDEMMARPRECKRELARWLRARRRCR